MALALILLVIGKRNKLEIVPAIILCGSMVLVHHLTAFIYFLVIAFFILLNFISYKKLDRCSKTFLLTGLGTLAAYSFFIVPYALKSLSLSGTSVLKFNEEAMITLDMAVKNMGVIVVLFGIIGLIFVLRLRISNSRIRFLLAWFTGLILFFAFFDHLYRMGAIMFFKENFSAFTPSRFLTLLSCPLACYAGFGLNQLTIKLGKICPVNFKPALVPLLCLAAAGIAIQPLIKVSERQALIPTTRAIAKIIKERTPSNAFIFDRLNLEINERCWLPYLTWRQTFVSPIPASENRRAVYRDKVSYLQNNLKNPRKIKLWLEQRGLEGYFILTGQDGKPVLVKLFKEKR